MRAFSRIGLVSAAAFAGLVASPAAIAQQHADHSTVCATSGRPFWITDAKGRYLALHFLRGEPDEAARFVTEFLSRAPLAAGVRHVFIRSGDAQSVKDWAAQFANNAGTVHVDERNSLASQLAVKDQQFTTIVFDKQGKELFRQSSPASGEVAAWRSFADTLAARTRAPALKDYNLPSGRSLALEGYDSVAYFTEGKAVKGRKELVSAYAGVSYQFSTEENRALFAANPEHYLPAYGGWCASAMGAKGTKVGIDPTNFKIRDGRLFLFYKGTFSDALKDWNKHESEWEPAADRHWKKLSNEDPIKPSK